jgi:hypothetical protein
MGKSPLDTGRYSLSGPISSFTHTAEEIIEKRRLQRTITGALLSSAKQRYVAASSKAYACESLDTLYVHIVKVDRETKASTDVRWYVFNVLLECQLYSVVDSCGRLLVTGCRH